ncbi:NAD(P)-binding protein [Lichtheimia hyalospora FSU 10163]|nr:NAD(P)-binding protein [Lichtheimia hyalospora FSU 10163]
MSLIGKVAVITGGGGVIGASVSRTLVNKGAKVVIGDIQENRAKDAAEELNENAKASIATYLQTDVTKYKDNIALFRHAERTFGGVDIAHLNAGTAIDSDTIFLPLDDEREERIFKINTMGVIKGTKVAILHMAARGGGVIVNTASLLGLDPVDTTSAYNASKHAVVGWTRSLRMMPQVCNVRVNTSCPFATDTGLLVDIMNAGMIINSFGKKIPHCSVDTVTQAVMQLIEDPTYNGATLAVLPKGVIKNIEQQHVDLPPEAIKPDEFNHLLEGTIREAVEEYKIRLTAALKRYQEQQ